VNGIPSSESIYLIKQIRWSLRESSLIEAYDPDIRPFTEINHWINESWVALYRARFALQMLEDFEYSRFLDSG